MQTWDPIVRAASSPRSLLGILRTTTPGNAVVLVLRNGNYIVSAPNDNLRRLTPHLLGIQSAYEIDMAAHQLEFATLIRNDASDANLRIAVSFVCKVSDPELVVRRNIRDAMLVLESPITDLIQATFSKQ